MTRTIARSQNASSIELNQPNVARRQGLRQQPTARWTGAAWNQTSHSQPQQPEAAVQLQQAPLQAYAGVSRARSTSWRILY